MQHPSLTFRAFLNVFVYIGYAFPVLIYFYIMSHFRWFRFEVALKRYCRLFFRLIGVKVIVKGNLQPLHRNSVIIMPNHVSFLDLPLLFGFIKVPVCGLEDYRHFHYPFFGKIIKRIGNIPINRRNPIQSIGTISKLEDINQSTQIVIFPEAGRSVDGRLLPLKRMPFEIAKRIDRPILPIYIYGMAEVNSKRSVFTFPGEIIIFIRPLIEKVDIQTFALDELIQKTKGALTFAPFVPVAEELN